MKLRFKPNSLKKLLAEQQPAGLGIDFDDLYKRLTRTPVSRKDIARWKRNVQLGVANPNRPPWETDPKTGEKYTENLRSVETWLTTPPERRLATVTGTLAQKGYSPEAGREYEQYYQDVYDTILHPAKSAARSVSSLLTKGAAGIPVLGKSIIAPLLQSGKKAAELALDPGLSQRLPTLIAAARFDPRIIGERR